MRQHNEPVVVVVPGDLHLTEAGLDNHRVAEWMVEEVNSLIRPDFVQFIGDNVQDATDDQFRLFGDLTARLRVPWHALVGDHDTQGEDTAQQFQRYVGKPTGFTAVRGFRFVRLNTQEARPVGMSAEQLVWLLGELNEALMSREQVVLFQHNYPYKVWETFDGPGLDAWREFVQTRTILATFTGHTHYDQIANDGRNVWIASRSIGDPEGGPPGYTLAFFHENDFALLYRTVEDRGPVVLITHPRDKLLATGPAHVVRGPDQVRVRIWSDVPVRVKGRVDDGPWESLEPLGPQDWIGSLKEVFLTKGEHRLQVRAMDSREQIGEQTLEFAADATGRFTAVPTVRPPVKGTKFC